MNHEDFVQSVAVSPETLCLIAGGLRGQIFIWDLNKVAAKAQVEPYSYQDPTGSLYAVAISKSGSMIAHT